MDNNKLIAKNTLFLYFRMFLIMAVSLFTVRVIIKTLSVSDYGLYGAVGGVIIAFGFITSVLTNASQRFFAVELGKGCLGNVKETFSTLFLTYLGVSIIIIVVAETLGIWFLNYKMTIPFGREDAAMWVYQFALLSFIVGLLANPYQALIIAHEKLNLYAYLSILDVMLKLLIVYLLLLFEYDKLKLYAFFVFITQLITNSVYVIYCRYKFPDIKLQRRVDRVIFNSVFSYSSWTLFGTIAGMLNTQGMNLLLNVFFGPIANAAYSVTSQIYSAVSMFATNFYTAVKPPLIKNYASGNYEYVQKLFLFSSKALFLLLFIVVLPLMICTDDIIRFWLGQVGEYMVSFVRLALIYTTILTISYPITAVVQAGGYVKLYHTLVDGFSILALPIVYLLFKFNFDACYAYITSIIIFAIAHVLRIYVLKRVFNEFDAKEYIIKFLIPSITLFIILNYTMDYISSIVEHNFTITILLCCFSSLLAALLGFGLVFSSHDRKMIINIICKKNIN